MGKKGVLTYGSLFTGIGGFDRGLDRAGMRGLWQCEADEFCRAVLRRHWPGVPCYPDVRQLGVGIPRVHVLCGGFPCQPVSLAGLGLAQADERWLWPEFARVVGLLRPRYVLVENVPGLLGRGLGDVLGDLAALGYDAEWDCLPASAFGAPHRRDRVWIVAYPAGGGRVSRILGLPGRLAFDGGTPRDVGDPEGDGRRQGRQGRPDPTGTGERESERPLQDADSSALQPWRVGGRAAQAGGAEWWAVEPPVGRVAHGVPDRLDQLAALGNALVPQIAEWLGRRIVTDFVSLNERTAA